MLNVENIKFRLRNLVENRNFYFQNTSKVDAERYLFNKTYFEGLDEREVALIEGGFSYSFPADFRDYLLNFGRRAGDLFRGSDFNPKKFHDYHVWAKDILTEKGETGFLDSNKFVFFFHQGYLFYYLNKEEDKYPVYAYCEVRGALHIRYERFADFVESELVLMEENHKRASESKGHFVTINGGMEQHEFPAQNSGIEPRAIGDSYTDYHSTDTNSWFARLCDFLFGKSK